MSGEPLSQPLASRCVERRKTLNNAIRFGNDENPLDPQLVVAEVRGSFFQSLTCAEVRHTAIIARLDRSNQ